MKRRLYRRYCQKIVLIGSTLFSSLAFAESDSILGTQVQPLVLNKSLNSRKSDNHSITLGVLGGFQFQSYSLTGTGFNSELPLKLGSLFGANLLFAPQGVPVEVSATFSQSRTEYTSLSGLTPSSAESVHQTILAKMTFSPLSQFKEGGISLGYVRLNRSASATSPTRVQSDYLATGPVLGVAHKKDIPSFWKLRSSLDFYFLNHLEESESTTGNLQTAYAVQLDVELQYALSALFSIGVHPIARMESLTFSGSGTRSVTGASERELFFALPLELKAHF